MRRGHYQSPSQSDNAIVRKMMLAWNNISEAQAPADFGPMNQWTHDAWMRVYATVSTLDKGVKK